MSLARLLIGSWLSVGGALAAAAQQPTFTARVEAVRVDVSVTKGREPVAGLSLNEFELLDHGVPQRIVHAEVEKLPLNVTLVLDVSGSVVGRPLMHLQAAGASFLDRLTKLDRAALMTFSHSVRVQSALTHDVAGVRKSLTGRLAGGATALRDAIYAGLTLRQPATGPTGPATGSDRYRDVLLVFTDGLDTASWLTENQVTAAASRADVLIYTIGLEMKDAPPAIRAAEQFLTKLANATGGRVWQTASSDRLEKAFLEVLDDIRTRWILSYYPTNVPTGGWHPLDVRVKRPGVLVKAREGYFAAQ